MLAGFSLVVVLVSLVIAIWLLATISGIHSELKRQSKILYVFALGMNVKVPDRLRPRGGFAEEFMSGIRVES